MIRTSKKIPQLFDCFWFLGPKVQRQLKSTWAETFRKYILPQLPIQELSETYRKDRGRPTKNLQTGMGLLVLQQMLRVSAENDGLEGKNFHDNREERGQRLQIS